MMRNLKLYTASAGSGKTYQLALSYIRELFADPGSYRKILAVTFTNKAAAEMKKRILEKLHQLSRGDIDAKDYADFLIAKGLANSEQHLQEKARKILVRILHDYSSFYVQTIDSFFQWVIRGFTREIGLQNGYNLELDRQSVLSEAVDRLIFSMDEDVELKDWLIKFAEEKVTEGKTWDFSSDLFMLGNEVFKENYQSVQNEAEDREVRKLKFNSLLNKLNKKIFSFENALKSRAGKAMELIHTEGLEISDFKYGSSGVITLFTKALNRPIIKLEPKKRNRSGAEDIANWATAGSTNESKVKKLAKDHLQQLLIEMLNIWDNDLKVYQTAILLKNNIYTFGILSDISDRIREVTRDKNLFLISDAPLFLKKIIADNDAPFIYEKAGNYFTAYMLDEFQDTSRFQWENFYPLIENGLATGEKSLVVGDVKQSIYRWRNSDWKILATELMQKISPGRIENIPLNTNFRSAENIIAFNNSIFQSVPHILKNLVKSKLPEEGFQDYQDYWTQLIDAIYGDPGQNAFLSSSGNKGYISHRFFENTDKSSHREIISEWIPELVKDLQDRNYRAGDITFLVRSANEGREVARILMAGPGENQDKYNFNVISNDSLFLVNNPAVKFLISLLKFLNQSRDELNLSIIKHEYVSYLRKNSEEQINWHRIFNNRGSTALSDLPDKNFTSFINQLDELRRLPLYELSEKLISIFELNQSEEKLAYVQAFQDEIMKFVRKETSDISAFLQYWENTGQTLTLNVSETQDALRIMTIHKAKGLEFKVVVIPFCDWGLPPESTGSRKTTLWPSTSKTGYDEFSHLPVFYSSAMKESHFSVEFFEETFRTYVDNLNLLYVAFTRAGKELHSCSRLEKNISNVGDVIHEIISNQNQSKKNTEFPSADLTSAYHPDMAFFAYGSPEDNTPDKQKTKKLHTRLLKDYPVNDRTLALNLNHKNIYLSDLKEDYRNRTGYGTQMHEIFSDIKTVDDIDKAVRKAWLKGLLNSEDRDNIQEDLQNKLFKVPFNEWFSGKLHCKTEADLYTSAGEIIRPDRVMITGNKAIILDYKFGNKKKSSYQDQIREYGRALLSAGYDEVNLYLWYYNLDVLEEVSL